jgi:hypothetical protein
MGILKELVNPNTALLNDTQMSVLLMIKIASSPQMAYATTNEAENLVNAREAVTKLGLAQFGNNMLILTDEGENMLTYHDLVDDNGIVTDEGNALLDKVENTSTSFVNQEIKENFDFLKNLL